MASNTPTPGNPRPDDRTPPDTPPQHESPLGEWLGAEEVGPAPGAGSHDPDPITEQVLFDDLLPLTNPPRPSEPIPTADPVTPAPAADPEDAVADVPPAGPGSGWENTPLGGVPAPESSLFEGGLLHTGSDVYREPAPSGGATSGPTRAPGSSIFEFPPPSAGEGGSATGNSDVFSGPLEEGSDVLRQIGRPDAGGSNIFDARPEGSGRFEDPADATEPVTEVRMPDGSGEWPAPDPLRPGSDLFEARPGSGVFEPRPGSELFHPSPEDNPPRPDSGVFPEGMADDDAGSPSSDVFGAEPTQSDLHDPDDRHGPAGVAFEDSGVDLLNPIPDLPADEVSAGGGSIFDMDKPAADGSGLDLDALPMPDDEEATESIHLPTGETGPRSDLFRGADPGTGDHDRVSFDLPDRPPGDPEPSAQVSGLIDWTAPVEGAELGSAGLSESEATEVGVPDLRGLTSETSAPVNTPGPARRPPSTVPDMGLTERRRPPSRPDSRPGSQWMFTEPTPARSSRTGWLAGTALGLLLGAGAVTGAYFAGLLPSRTEGPVRQAASNTPQTQAPSPAPAPAGSPAALLAAGDPTAALKAYEAAGEVSSPEDRAGRGQARFLARLRELAEQGAAPRADDPHLQQATADLEAVVQAADTLETDEQKRAGALAALHLGLIKELTKGSAEAGKYYLAVQKSFPAHKRMFEAAAQRVRTLPQTAPAKTARLTPREAEELARLAVLATVLLQAPTDGAADDDEPGFHFWQACQLNSERQYMKAANMILVARAAHEKRRLKLAGRGLNPLSDPLEQMFTRACTEIREYWVLKHHFYGHESLGNEMREHARAGSFPKFLSEVVALREEVKTGGGQKLAQVQEALTKATTQLKTATAAAMKAAAEKEAVAKERDVVAKEKEAVAKDLTAAKQSLDDQTKQLADARKSLDDARAKQKAADDALASVVRTLKANKLIDEKDDATAAVAKLPEVVRKASAAATSTDAKKAAEALVKAQKDLEAARAETDKAEAVAKKAADEATALRNQMDVAVKKATDAVTADARKKLDDLSAQLAATRGDLARREAERTDALKKAEAAFAAKLAAKEEDHRRQLADARAGVATPLTTGEVAARERASQEYDTGVRLFFAGRYAEAEAMLDRVTRNDATDARYWYYLALAQALQRKPAEEALKKGADLEAHGQPGRRAMNDALEPLPGSYRQWLARHRP